MEVNQTQISGTFISFLPPFWWTYLKLGQLLHELLLLFAVAERREDVEEDLQEVKALSGHTRQGENRRDAVRENGVTIRRNDFEGFQGR